MNEDRVRYEFKVVKLSRAQAKKVRINAIVDMQCELARLHDYMIVIKQEIAKLRKAPLPTTREEQIILHPGDKGYENAPYEVDVVKYQGDWVFSETYNTPEI